MATQIVWEAVLKRAANAGKNAILENYNPRSRREIVKRGVGGDLTLRIDEVSERAIYDSLRHDLGQGSFVFLSEEVGEVGSNAKNSLPVVVCDPLDGSHNAQVGIPFFSVALSVIDGGMPREFGAVSAAFIASVKCDDEYYATKKGGSYHNGTRLSRKRRQEDKIETLLVETGDIDFLRDELIRKLTAKSIYKIRILGSAALSYCLLADGTAGGFIFAQPGGARTIDSPAGYLIAKEAGCVFADISGKKRNTDSVRVAFDSRIDLVGAPTARALANLRRLVKIR